MVISSMEDEDKSYIISRLHSFRRLAIPCLDETKCRDYLKVHFTMPADISLAKPTAAVVDPDKFVTIITICVCLIKPPIFSTSLPWQLVIYQQHCYNV